jgi:hypothetical protein
MNTTASLLCLLYAQNRNSLPRCIYEPHAYQMCYIRTLCQSRRRITLVPARDTALDNLLALVDLETPPDVLLVPWRVYQVRIYIMYISRRFQYSHMVRIS